jgi:hypothetical protein
MSVDNNACLSLLASAIPCLPEDQKHYSSDRSIADHKMRLYEEAMSSLCWAAPLQSDTDLMFAAFSARFRWRVGLDEKDLQAP